MGPATDHLTHPLPLGCIALDSESSGLGDTWERGLEILHLTSDVQGNPSSSLTPIPSCCSCCVSLSFGPPCLWASKYVRAFDGGYSRLILLVFLPPSLESAIQENGSKTLGPLPLHPPAPLLTPLIPHSELLCLLIWALSGPAAAVATPARCSTEVVRAELLHPQGSERPQLRG